MIYVLLGIALSAFAVGTIIFYRFSKATGRSAQSSSRGPLGKRKLSHAKTVFCTMWCRLCVMSGIFRIPA